MDVETAKQFGKEISALKQEAVASLSAADARHLKKIIWTNRFFLFIGFATAWLYPNPLSMFAIALGLSGKWCVVVHHVCHGGYDNVPGLPKHYHSKRFAIGWRRYFDWFDWIYPPAWSYEHNILHHFYTNEEMDPDQLSYRQSPEKLAQYEKRNKLTKAVIVFLKMISWKITYYAFNTVKFYKRKQNSDSYRWHVFLYSIFPYLLFHAVLLPLLFLPFGWQAVLFVLINRIGAELITNIHTFLVIVPNHTGSDLALQKEHFKSKEEFYLNQIASTCNYHTGGYWRDYFHGYLNYQIEHHLFPDLPPSQYIKLQPKVKAICEKYGVNYIQEPLMTRVGKLLQVMHYQESMQPEPQANTIS